MLDTPKPLEPANSIIARCGGVPAVALWMGIDRSWVLRWTFPKDRGGTGGLIPAKHQSELLRQAQQHGVDLRPADFFPVELGRAHAADRKRKAAA